jgi:hypothetical protein
VPVLRSMHTSTLSKLKAVSMPPVTRRRLAAPLCGVRSTTAQWTTALASSHGPRARTEGRACAEANRSGPAGPRSRGGVAPLNPKPRCPDRRTACPPRRLPARWTRHQLNRPTGTPRAFLHREPPSGHEFPIRTRGLCLADSPDALNLPSYTLCSIRSTRWWDC